MPKHLKETQLFQVGSVRIGYLLYNRLFSQMTLQLRKIMLGCFYSSIVGCKRIYSHSSMSKLPQLPVTGVYKDPAHKLNTQDDQSHNEDTH